jgi:acetyl esterase/lipase
MNLDVFRSPLRRQVCCLVLAVLAGLLKAEPARADDAPAGPRPKRKADVRVIQNIAYYTGKDADPVRHRLDLYLPEGQTSFPVIFFVHGGAWIHGDKNHFGIYSALARVLARNGIGMVSTNYRLSPAVTHPEHIKDVARAFAWTHQNIARYGGRPDELFVAGHSAGGHLVALLATDETYLRAHGLSLSAIRGAIPISGVYNIPNQAVFQRIFSSDPAALREASPINHASAAAPPFLLIYGDHDLPNCDGPEAQALCRALCGKSCQAVTFEAVHRNHISIVLNTRYDDDPVVQRLLGFVSAEVTLHHLATEGAGGVDFLARFLARSAGGLRAAVVSR